jgi:predicted dehydrogenase
MNQQKILRWGVISTADIGMGKVNPGIQRSSRGRLDAISSRSLESAQSAAKKLGIPKAYGSYEALLEDPDIDAVYIPLPNHLHVDWALRAAEAGKHVLCEKPIGLNQQDAERLRAIDDKVIFMEAFMIRFHPQWIKARDMVRAGALGQVRLVQSVFSYFNNDANNVRNMADIGGGGMWDIGCYPVVGARFVLDREPERLVATMEYHPDFGTDILTSAIVDFGDGIHLTFTVSTLLSNYQRFHIFGTEQRLELEIPYNAPAMGSTDVIIDNGSSQLPADYEREAMPAVDQYALEADAMAAAILDGAPLPYGVSDCIQNMKILDAAKQSAQSGGWIDLS